MLNFPTHSIPPLLADQDKGGADPGQKGGLALEEREEAKTKKPKMWKVIMHNDHFTTMEFVVWVLMKVFHKPQEQATFIMLRVHSNGRGVAGIFTREVAETKMQEVHKLAEVNNYPLRCSIEEA